MSHQVGKLRGRLALPIVASLALGLAALPALGGAHPAHAAAVRVAQTNDASGQGPKQAPVPDPPRATRALIAPFAIPTGSTTITDCTTANLIAAIATYSSIAFNCHTTANTNAPVGGRYVLALTAITGPFDSLGNPALTIDGSDGGNNDITLDGANVSRVFTIEPGTSVTLKNLELAHGNASDGTGGTALSNGYGGGVEALGQLTATNVVFYQNHARRAGGALELDVDISLNKTAATTVDSITQSTLDGNSADGTSTGRDGGGAIAIDNNGVPGPQQIAIAGSLFLFNTEANPNSDQFNNYDGGAIVVDNGNPANVSIASSAFEYNSAHDTIGNSDGGAISVDSADNVTINASTFVGNIATDDGGAIDSNFRAFRTGAQSLVNVNNSTFTRNAATGTDSSPDGAALTSEGGILNVAFSTINDNGGPLNTGPAITNDSGTLRNVAVRNSILSNNTVGTTIANCGARPGRLPITDLGYNLEGPVGAATCPFSAANHDLQGVDPLLGPLGAYGGPTVGATGFALGTALAAQPTYTERLLAGSPAIDAVPATSCLAADGTTPLTTDQRGAGFVRPFPTACDIGAFEVSVVGGTPCGVFVGFFAPGGIGLSLRTGDTPTTVVSYLSLSGPAGQVLALPLVPRLRVADTLSCTVSDPNAPGAASPVTTATVDARVARSGNPAIPVGTLLRVVATRTAATETVTVSAINPDNSTGAILYTLTNVVQPNSFVVGLGTFPMFTFATPT